MGLLVCEILEGARQAEATAVVKDVRGCREFLPVDRDLLAEEEGRHWVPVSLIHVDAARQLALVGLPVEADSGAHRIWVKLSSLRQPNEVAL
jgi:hypothetical protein